MRILSTILALLTGLLSSAISAAPEFAAIQERAQGQSLTGGFLQNDSIYSNPASSAFTNVYAVEAAFAAPRGYSVSILDTQTSAIGGMVAYFNDPGHTGKAQGLKLGLTGKATQMLGVGISGKSLWGSGTSGTQYSFKDLDTGVLVNLNPLLLGASVRNVLASSHSSDFSRELSLGARYSYQEILNLSFATQSKWERLSPEQYGIGAEYISPYFFSIKAGYRVLPDTHHAFWSSGASLLSPRTQIHYAVEFGSELNAAVQHSLSAVLQM